MVRLAEIKGFGFKNKEIRATSNIEILREYYEKLLVEYENLIAENVRKDIELCDKSSD